MHVSDHDWKAPGAGAQQPRSPDAASAPSPGYGQPTSAPPGGAAWTPPPKPGLLPLRPLGFGTLLWAPFRTLRRNPVPTFGSGLVVQLVSVLATAAVFVPFFIVTLTRVENASAQDADAILSGAVGGLLLLMLVPVAVTVIASAFLQGVMVIEVATGTLGERLRFGALWRRAASRIWPLIGWTLLVALALILAFALIFLIIFAAASISPLGLAIGIAVAIIAGLGLIVLGAWLAVKIALVPSVIVLERVGIRASVVRSWRLTNGYFWRTFGTLLLVAVILNIAAQIVVQPVSLIGTILALAIDPTGTGSGLTVSIITTVVTTILSLLIGAITAVVQAALVAVIYIDLRMRKEGLDLELERHIRARDAGQPIGDPYLVPAAAAAPAPGATGTPITRSEPPATWS